MKDKQIAIASISLLLTLGIGMVFGYKLKRCDVIVVDKIVEKHDTQYVTSSPITIASKPINTIVKVPKYVTTYIDTMGVTHDTTFLDYPMYTSIDSLKSEFGVVVVKDSGDCSGIIGRSSTWNITQKVITNTKTITELVTKPLPLISIYGGVVGVTDNKFKVIDIAPEISVNLKQKYQINYGYLLNNRQHLIGVKTKIK